MAEYDRIIALLEVNPLIFRARETGWRVYPFDSGAYLLFYRELESIWLSRGCSTPTAGHPGSESNWEPG